MAYRIMSVGTPRRPATFIAGALWLLAVSGPANAQSAALSDTSPLQFFLGEDGSIQVNNTEYPRDAQGNGPFGQFFPSGSGDSSAPANAGYSIVVDSPVPGISQGTLYSGRYPPASGNQLLCTTDVLSNSASTFVAEQTCGLGAADTDVQLRVRTEYESGERFFFYDFTVVNDSAGPVDVRVFLGADLFVGGSDSGVTTFVGNDAVRASQCNGVDPLFAGRELVIRSVSSAPSRRAGGGYVNVSDQISELNLSDQPDSSCLDNGFAMQWNRTVQASASAEEAVDFLFSQTGQLADQIQFAVGNIVVDESAGVLNVQVTRSGSLEGDASVDFATAAFSPGPAAATANLDYAQTSGTLNWDNGDGQPKTIPVDLIQDAVNEQDESFQVVLSNPLGATLGDPDSTVITIVDDDNPGVLQIEPTSITVTEGDAGLVTRTFTVRRTAGSSGLVTVDYATNSSGLTATAGTDYQPASGTLSFADGVGTQTFTVSVIGDTVDEPGAPETFRVQLSNATNGATIGAAASALVSIEDDDDSPGVIGFNSTSLTLNEANSQASISVRRTNGTDGRVTASFVTVDGTALAGQDYQARSGEVVFEDGVATASIQVPLIDDALDEPSPNETFTVVLSSPTGGATLDPQGTVFTVNLVDNDADVVVLPTSASFQIGDVSPDPVTEGGGPVVVTVTRSGDFGGAASIAFALSNGSATAGQDFGTPSPASPLNFAAGQNSATVQIPIVVDGVVDSAALETFSFGLTSATTGEPNATVSVGGQSTATVSIQDADVVNEPDPVPGTLRFSQAVYSTDEGDGGVTLTILRDNGVDGSVLANVSLSPGTAVSGGSAPDFTGGSRSVSFADGQTEATVLVPISNDNRVEGTESFIATLTSSTPGAAVGTPASARVDILDDDTAPAPQVVLENQDDDPITVSVSQGSIAVSSTPASFASGSSIRLLDARTITTESVEEQLSFEVSGLNAGQTTAITIDLDSTTTAKALLDNLAVIICGGAANAPVDCSRVEDKDIARGGNDGNTVIVTVMEGGTTDKNTAPDKAGGIMIIIGEQFGIGGGGGGGSPSPALLLIALVAAACRRWHPPVRH